MAKIEIQNNLTIYTGFTPEELNAQIKSHREKFEKQCHDQGEYLPSDDEMKRWFPAS